jgi:hypothetical protein
MTPHNPQVQREPRVSESAPGSALVEFTPDPTNLFPPQPMRGSPPFSILKDPEI